MSAPSPYLSVVAASRNDDHGGDPLVRTQIFISTFARQCEKYRLPAELIMVDWNPVEGRPGLAGVLQLPPEASYCQARVITVPAVLHRRFKYADRVQFFQMIAKNAGIRRARGRFVLATNIDILFSDELMRHLARQQLDPQAMLRVDRYDIERGLRPDLSPEETLDYAWSHPVRSNRRFGPRLLMEHLYGYDTFRRHCQPDPEFCRQFDGLEFGQTDGNWHIRVKSGEPLGSLHTNACGDFTLLSREGWEAISGYPEFEAFSFNIDSVGIAAAHYAGYREEALLPPCVCFHIEHSLGSGWTPEGEKRLFDRLNKAEILNPEWKVLSPLVDGMREGKYPPALNGPNWGLAAYDLPEAPLLTGRLAPTPPHPLDYSAPAGIRASSLLPDFDLDRLSLWVERREQATASASPASAALSPFANLTGIDPHAIQVFIPDASGLYTEERSLTHIRHLHQRTLLHFFLHDLPEGGCIRLDPTHQIGLVEIHRLEVLATDDSRQLWQLDRTNADQLRLWGTARLLPPSEPGTPLRLLSFGNDPQIHLPALATTGRACLMVVELAWFQYQGVSVL